MRAKLPWILLALSLILNAAMIGGYLYERGRQDDPEQTAKTLIEMIARELALTPVEAEGLREIRRSALARRIEWRERRKAEGGVRDSRRRRCEGAAHRPGRSTNGRGTLGVRRAGR